VKGTVLTDMKLKIDINMDNAAFEDNAGSECARILRKLADELEDTNAEEGVLGPLFDVNGNKVGKATLN
jgi:hypothetical protein